LANYSPDAIRLTLVRLDETKRDREAPARLAPVSHHIFSGASVVYYDMRLIPEPGVCDWIVVDGTFQDSRS
jgi:hypothetical protein